MTITQLHRLQESVWIKGQSVEKAKKYKYQGTIIKENNEYAEEIRICIGIARNIFNIDEKGILWESLHLKIRILWFYVSSMRYLKDSEKRKKY